MPGALPPPFADGKVDLRLVDWYYTQESVEQNFPTIAPLTRDIGDLEEYDFVGMISEGSFGKVFCVLNKPSKQYSALKTFYRLGKDDLKPQSFLQELLVLNELKHKHIVRFIKCCSSKNDEDYDVFHLLFELCRFDLQKAIYNKNILWPLITIKTTALQILKGLEYIHRKSIMHRDIKPANILISNHGMVKIADFGMATFYGKPNIRLDSEICTLHYRAPELLLGCSPYDWRVDVWSAGVLITELYRRVPLLGGSTVDEQLTNISRMFGNINELVYPCCKQLPRWASYEKKNGAPCEKTFKSVIKPYAMRVGKHKLSQKDFLGTDSMRVFYDEHGVNLLELLLSLDPSNRPSLTDALKHNWFKTEPHPRKNLHDLVNAFNLSQNHNIAKNNELNGEAPKP
uniref:Protein kinase domain-containing protein n=1 Tax=Caenorhabditis tropicalis TaxID=1561998 RepID=A0A1I7URN0_9PELO